MSKISERLRTVSLFAGLEDEDIDRVCEQAEEVELPAGQLLFAEGDHGDQAYLITDGEIEILKTSSGRDVLLAVRSQSDVIGEMALLHEEPRIATARARTDASLLTIPKAALDDLLDISTSAPRVLFGILLQRWHDTEAQLRQSERMAQLGTLTAGLAHELNNPAAAVRSSADRLAEAVASYGEARASIASTAGPASEAAALDLMLERAGAARPPELHPLARSDREGEVGDWLDRHDVPDGWQIAPALVDLDLSDDDLDGLAAEVERETLPQALQLVRSSAEVQALLREVAVSASRVSAIVKALKSYSYLDQAPVQEVDIAGGLDDTLLILKSKTAAITVRREYDPALPTIEAHGSELNQVWTNLIDNAADAVTESGRDDGEVIVRAFPDGDQVVVEIEDNGTGIPAEIQDRIFDSFFTTKPPGSGTGLGLDISFGIVVNKHRGDLRLASSQPGRTVFRVELPRRPDRAQTGGADSEG